MRFILMLAAGAAVAFGQTTFSIPGQVVELAPDTAAQAAQQGSQPPPILLAPSTVVVNANRECAVAMPNAYRDSQLKFPTPVVKPSPSTPMKHEVAHGLPVCRDPKQVWDPALWNRFLPGNGKDATPGGNKDKEQKK